MKMIIIINILIVCVLERTVRIDRIDIKLAWLLLFWSSRLLFLVETSTHRNRIGIGLRD